MNYLFVHNNFPAQFRHVVRSLLGDGRHRIAAICATGAAAPSGILVENYDPRILSQAHVFARRFEGECQRAERVLYATTRLKIAGFIPDVIIAHSGWGETLPLREAFPKARIIVYCEFFYRSTGQDVGFDPEFPDFGMDGRVALNIKNASQLLALADADVGVSPTSWQRSTYPLEFHNKINVIHEGIDTNFVTPSLNGRFFIDKGDLALTNQDEVITYVSRNLEPLRGIHTFLRSLPELMRFRPKAHIVIVGGDDVSYGSLPEPPYRSWRERFWPEVCQDLDISRVHFVGQIPYRSYLNLLQVSTIHCYFTYPFVLSWSMLEAMSAECAIVASDTAPVTEVITEDIGRIVSFFDHKALSQTVCDLLDNKNLLADMKKRAREKIVANYDMEKVCRPMFLNLLRSL